MIQGRFIIIIVVAVSGALGGGILTYAIGIPSSPCAGVVATTRAFTIVAGQTGFNDSKYHQGSWPVMTVNRCEMVRITIINNDTQAHGFTIDYYAVKGVEVLPDQPFTFTFQVSRTGQFRVYCNVYCTVHIFMQNGLLNVV